MPDADIHRRGWWNMPCWNGLSAEQQRRLVEVGNLPLGYRPEGRCTSGAELSVETMSDEAPGPRFYCTPCGAAFLANRVDLTSAVRDDITLIVLAMDRHHDRLERLHLVGELTEAEYSAAISAIRDFQDVAMSRVTGEITQAQFEAVASVTQETLANLQRG